MNEERLARLSRVRQLRVDRALEALGRSRLALREAESGLATAQRRLAELRADRLRLQVDGLGVAEVRLLQQVEQRRQWFDEQLVVAADRVRQAGQAHAAAESAHREAMLAWRAACARAQALVARVHALRAQAGRRAERLRERAAGERAPGSPR